jgi:DNA polymerase (family 10)
MAAAAQEKGYAYLAISNHSPHVTVAHGLDRKRLAKQIEKIDRLNAETEQFIILKAIEVDILKDGSLDLADDILKELDVVIGAIHSDFRLSRQRQTERILRAMDNPSFNILAHPSGRLINRRHPYDVDLERLIEAASERGCFMELNAHPDRLDLDDVFCKKAKDLGVKIAVSTDAHSVTSLDYMRLGVQQARRGWLEPDDVLNTRGWKALKKLLQRS